MKTLIKNGNYNLLQPITQITRTGFLLVALLYALPSMSQQVQWAAKVLKYSSQMGYTSFSANKALGKPNATVDSAGNAWQPIWSGKEEFIHVEFDTVIKASEILIVESMNTGYIRKVSAFDADGMEYDVAHFSPKSGAKGPKLLTINVADFSIRIRSVKIVMFPLKHVPTTIDAIGVTSSDKPFLLSKTLEVAEAQR